MNCKECHRAMRPNKAPAAEYPGTVAEYTTGYCCSCYRRVRPPYVRHKRPECCVSCDRKLRPCGTTKADHPGTLLHKAGGLCKACYNRERAGQELTLAAPAEPDVEAVQAVDTLARGRAERKAKAEKAERLRQARIAQEAARARFIHNRRNAA